VLYFGTLELFVQFVCCSCMGMGEKLVAVTTHTRFINVIRGSRIVKGVVSHISMRK
jgi:hypothetical protein